MKICGECRWFMVDESGCAYHFSKTDKNATCDKHLTYDNELHWKQEVKIMDEKSKFRYLLEQKNEEWREMRERVLNMSETFTSGGHDIEEILQIVDESYGKTPEPEKKKVEEKNIIKLIPSVEPKTISTEDWYKYEFEFRTELVDGKLFWSEEERLALLHLLLYNVGLEKTVDSLPKETVEALRNLLCR